MSQNQEIIESKLCAYIDGELDADGRTEIEKHLDANPQHRRLLESLKATRDLIKWLPREPAPPELAETLNGQLERSVLLDFDERSLNRNIWPRVLSAAAIVLLTAGLAAAVYFTLPKSQKSAMPYAIHNAESQSPMPDGIVPEAATEPTKPDDALVAAAPMEKTAAPVMAMRAEADRAPNPELDRLADDVSQNRAAIVAVANGAGAGTNLQQQRPMASNAIVMLVQADSPEQATRDVTSYLASQKIQWKPATLAATSAPATSQLGGQLADRARDLQPDAMSNRDARRAVQNQPTTRPDLSSGAYGALRQLQSSPSNPAQQSLSTTGLYVARMSRQQAIDLNNSVRQRKSQQSELKELGGPSAGANYSIPGQDARNQVQQIQGADKQSEQGQAAAPPVATPAPQIPQNLSQGSRFAASSPATQQAAGGFGAGGFGGGAGGGGGGRGGGRGIAAEPTTLGPASQAATTEPVDSPVDVVIVVQPETTPATEPASSALPQTEPAATQPAVPQPLPQTQPASH